MQKLKKAWPYLLIVIFVGWFSYKFFVERKLPKQASMALDWDELDATGAVAEKTPSTMKKEGIGTRVHSTLSKDEEEDFRAFDEMEEAWLETVQAVLGDTFYPRYIEMRALNEKEKMQAYKDYHDFMRKKYGDKFTHNISEDQSVLEKKINQHYLKELLAMIGPEKFQQYLKARDSINEANRKKNKEFIQVEF